MPLSVRFFLNMDNAPSPPPSLQPFITTLPYTGNAESSSAQTSVSRRSSSTKHSGRNITCTVRSYRTFIGRHLLGSVPRIMCIRSTGRDRLVAIPSSADALLNLAPEEPSVNETPHTSMKKWLDVLPRYLHHHEECPNTRSIIPVNSTQISHSARVPAIQIHLMVPHTCTQVWSHKSGRWRTCRSYSTRNEDVCILSMGNGLR